MNPKKLRNPIFLFNAFVLAGFIILNIIASGYSEGARRFPKFVLGIGIGVTGFWMITYFMLPKVLRFIESQEEAEAGGEGNPLRFYLACLCVVISVLLGYLLGFLFLVPVAFLGYGFLLGDRTKWVTLIMVTVITTTLFYFCFDYLLNIPLLKGAMLDFS